jgi:hypothetical protein
VAGTLGLADAVHTRCLQRPPGAALPGDPEHYPGKDAVADYLEQYAQGLELPIRYDSRVSSLEPAEGGYRLGDRIRRRRSCAGDRRHRRLPAPLHTGDLRTAERRGHPAAQRRVPQPRSDHGDTLIGTSLRALKRHHGVELVDRTVDAHERTTTLEGGRELEGRNGHLGDRLPPRLLLDPRARPRPARRADPPPRRHGRHRALLPRHKNQYSRGSSLIHWVRHDAEFIVDQLLHATGGRR